jgi:hypothetical protein
MPAAESRYVCCGLLVLSTNSDLHGNSLATDSRRVRENSYSVTEYRKKILIFYDFN